MLQEHHQKEGDVMITKSMDIGQHRERLVRVGIVMFLVLFVLMLMLGIALLWRTDDQLSLGHITTVPVGGVAYVPVAQPVEQTFFGTRSRPTRRPVVGPVYLVRPSPTEVLVFAQRDPHNGCLLTWQPNEQYFIDPCHGSTYAYTGAYVRGPARRGLDRFPASIRSDGEILIRAVTLTPGLPAR